MLKKKGQKTGSQAATLIGLITLILIAYILFLPPEDRETLLEDESTGTYFMTTSKENVTLLNVTSLRLEYIGASDYEHTIPNVYLYEKTESDVIETATPFYIRSGWFDKKTNNMSFYIEDLENTKNVAFSFETPKAKGRLMVYLNGIQVFDYEVSQVNVGPIQLKKELLKDGENTLFFSVEGVGIKFWSTNEYSIEDLQVTGDYTDITHQESMNIFTIKNEEFYNLETSRVQFYPVCKQNEIGKLEVLLNNRPVFSSVPDCGMINRQDIFTTDLNPGKNTISFKTNKGSYRIELIKVLTELKDIKTFLEYFEVNGSLYDEIDDNEKEVMLEIEFVDDEEDKEAQLNINGHLTQLDQRDAYYSRSISSWVNEGARNYFEITPETLLKIVEIKITIIEE